MGGGMPAEPVNVAVRETGIRARWRHHRATRPHGTVRVSLMLTHLRLYAPVMKLLHRWGQCFMTTQRGPDGAYRRKCTWCGHSYRLRDPAAAEASLRAATLESSDASDPFDKGGVLPSGVTPMTNRTGKPIAVLTGEQWQTIPGGEA